MKELVFVVRVQLGEYGATTEEELTPERIGEAIDLMTYIGDEVRVGSVLNDETDPGASWHTPGFRKGRRHH